MQGGPEVTVLADDLGGASPVALRDTLHEFRLAIDFTQPPEQIVAALAAILQESVDTGRWVRQRTKPVP